MLSASADATPNLSAEHRARLDAGGVVVVPKTPTGDSGVAALGYGVVDAPVNRVWPVVRDCQHFHKFMPRTAQSEVRDRKGNAMKCYFKLDMPFPFSDMWSLVNTHFKETAGGGFIRHWSLIEGTYSRNDGSWAAYPWGADQTKTLLVYTIDVNPKVAVPDFIIRKAQTGTLPDVFDAIRKRVRTLNR